MLDKVSIVLVGTSHPGNIGSAARAMKVMGLTQLILVDPQCEVDGQTIALASGASDVATNAKVFDTLEEALAESSLVVGTSARSRSLNWPMIEPRETGLKLIEEASQGRDVALVFGRERTGLTNEELQQCHYHVSIPANPEYSSLNLAMAVQTICYEIRMSWLAKKEQPFQTQSIDSDSQAIEYPRHNELALFYQHLEKVLFDTEFIKKDQPNLVMNKLKRLFTRARPEKQEINILRGILTAVEKSIENKAKK